MFAGSGTARLACVSHRPLPLQNSKVFAVLFDHLVR